MENSGTINMSCGTTVIPSRDASLGLVTTTTFPADKEITLVGRVHTAQNLNERGFPGAIFSDQGMDFAAMQIKVHAIERRHTGKTLCDLREVAKPSVPGAAAEFILAPFQNRLTFVDSKGRIASACAGRSAA